MACCSGLGLDSPILPVVVRHNYNQRHLTTYTLAFFLGPDLPLDLDRVSPAWLKVLLLPDLAWVPFRPFWSVAADPLAGVEALSETLSTEDGRAAGSGDDDAGEGSFSFTLGEPELFFPLLSENPLNSLGDSLRTTTALGRPDRLERPLGELVEVVAGIVAQRAVCSFEG